MSYANSHSTTGALKYDVLNLKKILMHLYSGGNALNYMLPLELMSCLAKDHVTLCPSER